MIILEGTVDLGELFQGQSTGLHDQIIDGDLHPIFADIRIEGLAHGQGIRHIDFAADIKMRNGLFRLGQAASDEQLHP